MQKFVIEKLLSDRLRSIERLHSDVDAIVTWPSLICTMCPRKTVEGEWLDEIVQTIDNDRREVSREHVSHDHRRDARA